MNHDALLQLLRTRPTTDRLLDSILAEARDARTIVDDVVAHGEFSRRQVVILMRDLEPLGYGEFKVGRKGHPSRFEWSVDPAQLEAVLDGGDETDTEHGDAVVGPESLAFDSQTEVGDDDDAPKHASVLFMQANQAGLDRHDPVRLPKRDARGEIEHVFVLRPNYRVTLTLPDDLTPREAEVISGWTRSLSFER